MQHPYDLKLEERYSYDKATDTHDLWVLESDKPHAPPPNKTAARDRVSLQRRKLQARHRPAHARLRSVHRARHVRLYHASIRHRPDGDDRCRQGRKYQRFTHAQVFAHNMNGKWFNWKVIHDTAAEGKGAIKIYIDDKLADGDISAKKQSSYYFKCGLYSRKGSERDEVKVRNIKYWVKGE